MRKLTRIPILGWIIATAYGLVLRVAIAIEEWRLRVDNLLADFTDDDLEQMLRDQWENDQHLFI